jgi:hypothetical protein
MLEALLVFFVIVGVILALSAKFGWSFLVWGIGALIYFGLFILFTAIDYAFNASIIDAIPPEAVSWWHFFTFDHYMTWMFRNNLELFMAIHAGISIVAGLLFYITVEYES